MTTQRQIIAFLLVVVTALALTSCGPEPIRTTTIDRSENSIARTIYDYGVVDGCSVKFIVTTTNPNFWLVKCPGSTVTTEYETGSKNRTRIGAVTDSP